MQIKFLIPISLISLFFLFASCGGLDTGYNYGNDRGYTSMEDSDFFQGQWEGYQMILDRNGNIRETAQVQRVCQSSLRHKGLCVDRIHYTKGRRDLRKFEWNRSFQNDKSSSLSIEYKDGSRLSGKVPTGRRQWFLKGSMMIPSPGSEQSTASVQIRYHTMPGPGRMVFETQVYRSFLIKQGELQIVWIQTKGKEP